VHGQARTHRRGAKGTSRRWHSAARSRTESPGMETPRAGRPRLRAAGCGASNGGIRSVTAAPFMRLRPDYGSAFQNVSTVRGWRCPGARRHPHPPCGGRATGHTVTARAAPSPLSSARWPFRRALTEPPRGRPDRPGGASPVVLSLPCGTLTASPPWKRCFRPVPTGAPALRSCRSEAGCPYRPKSDFLSGSVRDVAVALPLTNVVFPYLKPRLKGRRSNANA
jgi:hypothetical protein